MNDPVEQSRRPVTLKEMSAGLIWIQLFRATKLALQPSRLGLAFMVVALIMATGALFDLATRSAPATEQNAVETAVVVASTPGVFSALIDGSTDTLSECAAGVVSLEIGRTTDAMFDALVALSPTTWADQWIAIPVLIVILLSILAIGGGAISRMAAVEIAGDYQMTAPEALGFSLARARHFALSLLAPLIAMGLLFATLSLAGWALFSISWLSPVGGLGYGLMLLGGLMGTVLLAGYFFGAPLLVPSVAVESTDWLDSVQRTYAYILGRPGRIAVYLGVSFVYGLVCYAVVAWVAAASLNLTATLTAFDQRVGAEGAEIVYSAFDLTRSHVIETGGGAHGVAALLAGVWQRLLVWLVGAFVLSYFFCASTIIYLLARRINDLQDIHEIWTPEVIPSTMAPVADSSTGADSGS